MLLPIEREPPNWLPQGVLTSYLSDESRVSRPLDDGAWKPACESDAASRLQRPTRTPVQPAGMEARQRVERCAARVRAEREDRLETRQTGAQPRDRTPIRSLQNSCTAIVLAGLGWILGAAPRFTPSQSAVLLLNDTHRRNGVALRSRTGLSGFAGRGIADLPSRRVGTPPRI